MKSKKVGQRGENWIDNGKDFVKILSSVEMKARLKGVKLVIDEQLEAANNIPGFLERLKLELLIRQFLKQLYLARNWSYH